VSYITPAEDRDVTQRLKEAGRLLGISVLEHIIITEYGYATL
jgi:DNA repair protein RadC